MKHIWSKQGGIESTVIGPFDVYVKGMRGDWMTSYVGAPGTAIWKVRNETCDKRNAPITFAKLESALEKARATARRNALSCGYDGSQLATLEGAESIVDGFVSTLIQALGPEGG